MDEFFGTINNFVLAIGAFLFDWLLVMGQTAALLVIALVTSAILTFVRPLTTKQKLLAACEADKKILSRRLKQAKARKGLAKSAGDKEAVAAVKDEITNLRMVIGKVAMKQAGQEGKPLLVALLPVVLVFVWASDRLAYVPAAAGQEIPVHVYYPNSAVGRASHLLIEDGLVEAEGAVIRRVWKQTVEEGQIANGQVDWKLTADARPEQPYVVKVFFDGHVYEKELRIGARYNSPVMEMYGDGDGVQVIELGLEEMKPFGFLPNIQLVPAWGMYIPAWMFVYLLVTIPFVFGLKGIFKIL